ncbi:hypothetical protein [Streptomyces sp. NPDC018584]|uniref:hypothetical protein n=1 Tax=unclassified Streptomyces TaxID=2593676 RepID=UPI0037944FF9
MPRDDLKNPKHRVPVPIVPTEVNPNPPAPPFSEADFAEPGFLAAVEEDIARRQAPTKKAA